MFDKIKKINTGFAIIEVLVVVGVISLVIVSVSQVSIMSKKASQASADQMQALSYAQEWLEIITAIKDDAFACCCYTGGCSCTQAGGSCTALPLYKSCWTEYPKNFYGLTEFKLTKSGIWQLQDLGGTPDPCPNPRFSRKITIKNLAWDADGRIAATGGTVDYNTKEVTVTVYYLDGEATREASLKTILTAWENLN